MTTASFADYPTGHIEGRTGIMITDLFPFRPRCQQADDCLWDSSASGNDSCMVNELVCSHLEDEQGTDEGSNAVRDDVAVSHNVVKATRR